VRSEHFAAGLPFLRKIQLFNTKSGAGGHRYLRTQAAGQIVAKLRMGWLFFCRDRANAVAPRPLQVSASNRVVETRAAPCDTGISDRAVAIMLEKCMPRRRSWVNFRLLDAR
jgi:hypothetical protein